MGILDAPPGYTRRAADAAFQTRRKAWTATRLPPTLLDVTHPDPPTLGSVASATAIVSPKTWASVTAGVPSMDNFTALGVADPILRGVSFPDTQMVTWASHTRAQFGIVPYRLRFWFDGTELDIRFGMYNGVAIPQVLVDGMFTGAPTLGSSSPHDAYLPITFDTRATRLIELRMNVPFGGVKTGPNDSIWPAGKPGPRCVIVGDSYTDQSSSTGALQGFAWHFADAMGWPDTFVSGVGGSGYVNAGQGVKLRDRLQNDVIDQAPDVVLSLMGHNDGASNGSPLQTECNTTFTQLRAGLPDARVIVTGPITQGDNLGATYAATEASIFAGAAGLVDHTISLTAPWWITGSGRSGATTGSGNADYYTFSDGVHFTDAGHRYFGLRLAEVVTNLLAA